MKLPKYNLCHLLYTKWTLVNFSQELHQWVGRRHSCLRRFEQRAKLQTCPRTWAWTAQACWCSAGLCREKGVSTPRPRHTEPLQPHDAWQRANTVNDVEAKRPGAWCCICRSRRPLAPERSGSTCHRPPPWQRDQRLQGWWVLLQISYETFQKSSWKFIFRFYWGR